MNSRNGNRSHSSKDQDNQEFIDNLNFLHKISQKISEIKPLPQLLNEIMESSKLLMNAEASSLLLYDSDDKKLYFHVATGAKGKLIKEFSVELGQGIAGWVAEHRKPLLIEDCYKDPRFCADYDQKSNFETKSLICVPLLRKERLLGVMQVINKKEGDVFQERDLSIFETLASQCSIAIENHRLTESLIESEALERELATARSIQEKLLPDSLPQYDDIQVAAQLIPAKQVGGDFYTIQTINSKLSLFMVADVSGKGIPAALIVSTIYSCLNSYLMLHSELIDLIALITTLNRLLIQSTTTDKFATCWIGLYFHDTKKLLNINAGHNPPMIFRTDQTEPIQILKGGPFIGGLERPYKTEEVQLLKHDVLLFFSDGVTEAMNDKHQQYEETRLIDVCYKHINNSAREILHAIEMDVKKHVHGAAQSDDYTCAVVKVL